MRIRINLENGSGVIAWNRCADCGNEWQDKPMGFAQCLTCPRCRCEYWEWLNYEAANRQGKPVTDDSHRA